MVKQIIVVRKDLNMRKGKMIAQGAHASMGFLFELASSSADGDFRTTLKNGEDFLEWSQKGTAKIAVGCGSEEELLDLYKQAKDANLPVYLVRDTGKTEFHGVPTYTALAIGPSQASALDPITGHLKLL